MGLGRLLEFALVIKAVDDASGVIRRVDENVKNLAASTQKMREVGQNLVMAGAGTAAMGTAIVAPFVEAVRTASSFQGEMAHVATAIHDGAEQTEHLAAVRRMAEGIAQHSVITETNLAQAYYIGRSNMLNHVQALAAVAAANQLTIATTEGATQANAAMADSTRLMTALYANFGNKVEPAREQMAGFADILAKLQTEYAFKNIGEVIEGFTYAAPYAKAMGTSVQQAAAALAIFQTRGLYGTEAGESFEELSMKLMSDKKLQGFVARTRQGGVDLVKTVANFKAAFGGIPKAQLGLVLSGYGITERSIRGLEFLMAGYKKFAATAESLHHAQGAAAAAAAIREHAADEQFGVQMNRLHVLSTQIGTMLLPAVVRMAQAFGRVVDAMSRFAEHHKTLVKYAALFAAISGSLLIIVGMATAAAGAFLIWASFLPALTGFVSAMSLASMATRAWTIAQWALNAALTLNPIGVVVAAATALAAIGYEVWKHWAEVKKLFLSIPGVHWLISAAGSVGRFFGLGGGSAAHRIAHTAAIHHQVRALAAATTAPAFGGSGLPMAARAGAVTHVHAGVAGDVHVHIHGNANEEDVRRGVLSAIREHAGDVHRVLNNHAASVNRLAYE